jgi:hypothetical protein
MIDEGYSPQRRRERREKAELAIDVDRLGVHFSGLKVGSLGIHSWVRVRQQGTTLPLGFPLSRE